MDIFEDFNLAHAFMHCKVKRIDQYDWVKNLGLFFLPKGVQAPPGGKSWTHLAYWNEWGSFKENQDITERDVQLVRKQIFKRFSRAVWLVIAASDRLWNTRKWMEGEMFPRGADPNLTAPIVLLNPEFRLSQIQWLRGLRSARDRERQAVVKEAEESEEDGRMCEVQSVGHDSKLVILTDTEEELVILSDTDDKLVVL
ncbi:uncharacterized protein EI90DRAFT_3021235 [Cantharellus anzutake]|uniref:uncharacterized protein n=1 Tax=Cantharellus anzutake TaxID=1750568 RepID=UPI001904A3D2|nr:uncharacterized protein EI90DRAFT_3021235 [Cantharellus anzutake]KAF8317831.1 hypothetical protein EI90DRAFT_3021235 [Cantharellus anzutake]